MSLQSPGERLSSAERRRLMVDRQVRTFDVTDQLVAGRMLDVPREMFVDEAQRALAYSDSPITLKGEGGHTRVLLAPLVVARMMQAAAPLAGERVLDLGGATGYVAALFAGLVEQVVAVESDAGLASQAAANFSTLGLANARSIAAPLATGGAGPTPYDIIFANGCIEEGLDRLAGLLSPVGRIIAIVPKASGALTAAHISGRGADLSVRPLFDAQAPVLDDFARTATFSF